MDSKTPRKSLDKKLKAFPSINQFSRPNKGWIRAVREALGMTSAQLAKRLDVSRPRITYLEQSEIEESVTLATLRKAAAALDCSLVYAFIPRKSFQETVEERAQQVATKLIKKVDHTMALEDQNLGQGALTEQIEDLAKELLRDKVRILWEEKP